MMFLSKNIKEVTKMKFSRFLALLIAVMMIVGLAPASLADEEPVKISVAGYMFGPIDN